MRRFLLGLLFGLVALGLWWLQRATRPTLGPPLAPAEVIARPRPAAPLAQPAAEMSVPAAPLTGEISAHAAPPAVPQPASPVPSAAQQGADARDTATSLVIVGYCNRCQGKHTLLDAELEITASGRHAARGICSNCGGNVFTFVKE